jgi:hypothetical protein
MSGFDIDFSDPILVFPSCECIENIAIDGSLYIVVAVSETQSRINFYAAQLKG